MLAGPGLLPAMDGYAGNAYVEFYGGTQPSPGGSGGGPLVCTAPLNKPSGSVSAGTFTLSFPTSGGVALVSLAPTWARIFDGNGTRFFDVKCRLIATADDPLDPAAIVVNATAVAAGALLRFSGGTINLSG